MPNKRSRPRVDRQRRVRRTAARSESDTLKAMVLEHLLVCESLRQLVEKQSQRTAALEAAVERLTQIVQSATPVLKP